ncbi:POK9 protein, partial [Heliornis fulica]|nr:POK9 protein [Heliornis fulica]
GSLSLDVAAAVDVTLINKQPQRVPMGLHGPLMINGKAYGALLMGRSSTGLNGLFVLPGLIDSDFVGEIQVVIQAMFPLVYIPKGNRIVQLIPLPQLTAEMQFQPQQQQGTDGFGSTGGLTMLTMNMNRRPTMTVSFTQQQETIYVSALLDTGADLTIVS